ncbi:unnamed protein product [Fraxinus pennsylvanica]|uniref:Ubiquitin-like domain-containing protein n=1 Tax=Fraxinus pennsylvanica TaxID=56036 RepID=A0AAD2DK40_9LAMI|nr:unnamed protein product [Fraxinus pennsylvanica]
MSGVSQDEDKKPGDQSIHINLKVKGQDGSEVVFRIKRSTQLKKLMNAYCDRQSVEFNSIAFLFDGRRLRGEQTPDELEMEEGDEIDAMLHQTGEFKVSSSSVSQTLGEEDTESEESEKEVLEAEEEDRESEKEDTALWSRLQNLKNNVSIQGKQTDSEEEDAVSEEEDAESVEEATESGNLTIKTQN